MWTQRPTWQVGAGLPPGPHRFALYVVAPDGRRSQRDVVVVQLRPDQG